MTEHAPCVLLIEDDFQIRRVVRNALERQGMRVEEAAACASGLEKAGQVTPELVVLDLGLPDRDGIDFITDFRLWSQAPILILTARFSEAEKILTLDAGADDYLTKPFGLGELLARVRALLRRQASSTEPALVEFGETVVDLSRHQVLRAGAPVHLTATEYRLLAVLIANQGRVMTHQQLGRAAWGNNTQHGATYLRVYVGRLRQKLERDPARPAHLQTEIGVGYRFVL